MTIVMLNSWLKNISVSADTHHHDSGSSTGHRTPNFASRSSKALSCDCNSQGPWKPIFKPSSKVKSLASSAQSYPNNYISGEHDNFNQLDYGSEEFQGSGQLNDQYPPVGQFPSAEQFPGHFPTSAQLPPSPQLPADQFAHGEHLPRGQYSSEQLPANGHFPSNAPYPGVHPTAGEPLTPANRHMIHVHLIPHLYVPIMNQPGPGGSEDHKIQENHIPHQQEGSPHYPQQQSDGPPQYPQQQSEGPPHYPQQQSEGPSAPPATSAEVTNSAEPPRGEKHIEENHIIENHYDEFGNPYDPNQSGEDEDDEGEITNVDIHTYSSDDQGGSSHTHYTKNNGVSYESHEETAPSGLGDLTGDHGAQSSSYENSNSYYTIPPNANIHHYNMHREYDHLLSKQPSLHDLNDYKPKPIILNQYQVHENTEEDTSNNNLAPITVSRKPDAPQPTNSPSHNEINTNHLNLNNKHQYGKHYVNQLLDNKHGKHIRLPSSSSVSSENNYQTHLHDSAVKMIVSPNTQLKQNSYSPQHYSFSRAPSYFFDQNRLNYSLKPMQQDGNKPLHSQGGHIPIIKSITVNNEKLPAITLTSDKVTINLNHKLINRNNPFNHRVQLNNKLIPLKSTPSTLNSIASNHLQDGSYFNSKDFLKPLYSFQHLPQLQPLFNADSSNNNNRVLFSNSNNFNMMKLKPQRLSDYAKLSPNRQNYVRKMIMNRQDDVSKNLESMRPPPPAQRQTWSEHYLSRPKHPFQQIIPDSYAKITLPKSIYHLNLIKAPVLSSPNTLQQRIAVGG